MAMIMKVSGIPQLMDEMHAISRQLPKTADKDMWNVAQIYGAELRKGMDLTGIQDFNGTLRRGTVPHRGVEKYSYQMLLPRHAEWLNRMPPHDVWLYNKPELQRWAKQRLGYPSDFGGKIFVRKRPFIDIAYNKLLQRLRPELENGETIKMLRRKGK